MDINLYGAKEMTQQEMINTEGGSVLVATGLLLLSTFVLQMCSDGDITITTSDSDKNNSSSDSSVTNQGNGNGNGNDNGNGNGNNGL